MVAPPLSQPISMGKKLALVTNGLQLIKKSHPLTRFALNFPAAPKASRMALH